RNEIRKARTKTAGIIGVNVMMALTDYEDHLTVAVEEGADLIISGAGLPLRMPAEVIRDKKGENKTKFLPIVSSAKAAALIFRYWESHYGVIPDGVVVEGPKAGGHLGYKKSQIENPDFTIEKIIPAVVEAVKPFEKKFKKNLPVIAAGGIYSGSDIFRLMRLGAQGVQMATRFVPTYECDASPEFKEAYINSSPRDIVLIDSPVGLPGRAINNQFLKDVSAGKKHPVQCPWQCLKTCDYKKAPYCISLALINAARGKLKNGFVFAGNNAFKTTKIQSVREVFQSLKAEFEGSRFHEVIKNGIQPEQSLQTIAV
ncbi:MAG TPA: nitronate monooxygenase, partial [Bacteroidetes bacterium]|nr:nitronate monooxygenase [Bacteroidota bacterium]